MNIKDNDTPILHTKETTEVTNKTTSVQTKPSSYNLSGVDRTINARSYQTLLVLKAMILLLLAYQTAIHLTPLAHQTIIPVQE